MQCPHCRVEFHDTRRVADSYQDADGPTVLAKRRCPACGRTILHLDRIESLSQPGSAPLSTTLIWPKATPRPPASPEVPAQYAEDYKEACLILADSPKASAALSRRCLQNILRDVEGVKHGNLYNEIQEAINNGGLPSYIEEQLDAVRVIGNFAAHPMKDQSSGQVLPVEPGEAEWNLDVLESLFDHYFLKPAIAQKRRATINQKLQQAGKNPI